MAEQNPAQSERRSGAARDLARELPWRYESVQRALREAAMVGVSTEEASRGLRNVARSGAPELWTSYMEVWRREALRKALLELEAMLPWYSRAWRRLKRRTRGRT